jgi:hypothetical protein
MIHRILQRVESPNNSDHEYVGDDDLQTFTCAISANDCTYVPIDKLFREETGKQCDCISTLCVDCVKAHCIYNGMNKIPTCPGRLSDCSHCNKPIDTRKLFSSSCLSCGEVKIDLMR